MPLHLKQKLRKALGKHQTPTSGPNDGEGRFVQAGSLREVASEQTSNTAYRNRDYDDARAEDSLAADVGQLSLGDDFGKEQEGLANLDGALTADYEGAAAQSIDTRTESREGSHPGFANPARISSDDPYSERVADRNISPPREWTHREDVDVQTTHLPAVTHETRIVDTHEIVQQQITRDIHNYDIVHRELPVIDVEVLPPRHFVPSKSGDGLVEIPASQVPGGGSDDAAIQRSIKQALLKEKLQPRSAGAC